MKVKVTKATLSSYWYADKIGEVFDVEQYSDSLWGYTVIPKSSCNRYFDNDDVEIINEEKVMKKSDLKTGMRVVTKADVVGIVLVDIGIIAWKDGGFTNLSNYRDDLTYNTDAVFASYDDWNIKDVHKGYTKNHDVLSFDHLGELLWVRDSKTPEQKQLDKITAQITELKDQADKLQSLMKNK